MQNQYLEILELSPGASKAQIKSAYRRLSKIYHPDVSKDENAREKFIEVNEAYKFLLDVGPRPGTIQSTAPAYDYDVQNQAYDQWRQRAKAYASQQAKEAIRRQQILTKMLLKGFEILLVLILIFNVVLLIDSHLPTVAHSSENWANQNIVKSRATYYDILNVNGYIMHLEGGILDDIKGGEYQLAVVYSTPWLDKPQFLDLNIHGKQYRFKQYAGVYGFFSFFMKAILLLALIYKVLIRSLDSQLSIAILLLFLSVFQLFIFFKY